MKDSPLPELSIGIIEQLKNRGYSQTEIAEIFGVSRQAVSWHKRQYNGSLTPRESVRNEFPWEVTTQFCQAAPYKRLRDHGEFMATGGKGMKKYKLKRLLGFYNKLRSENVVVEFDPTFPPESGVSNSGGWRYQTRIPKDEDMLIRVNKSANLTERGLMIWRFPPTDPRIDW